MEEYINKLNIPSHIKHIKIDVGLGEWNAFSSKWLEVEKDLFVIMFEPNIDSITKSVEIMQYYHVGENNNSLYHIIPIALSNVETPTELDFYKMQKDAGTSSLYKPIDESLGLVKEKTMVNVFSLKHFFDLFDWNRFEYIEYIKIDAQGADFDIIKGSGNYLEEKVVYITAEPESKQYENCLHNTEENMESYLTQHNFIKINHPNTHDPTFINKKFLHLQDSIYIWQ
jgi:FkbM family methyltransferase